MTKMRGRLISIAFSLIALSMTVMSQSKPQTGPRDQQAKAPEQQANPQGQTEKVSDSPEQQTTGKQVAEKGDLNLRREAFINDLKILSQETRYLNNSTAVATVKVGIADVSWKIDKRWSQDLLLEALDSVLPSEKEREKLKLQSYGTNSLIEPTEEGRAQKDLRNRILSLAGRDKIFGELILEKIEQNVGKMESNSAKVSDTFDLIKSGKAKEASKALLELSAMDPSTVRIGYLIREMASIDRAAADQIILEYLRVAGNQALTLPILNALIQDIGFAVFPFPPYDRQKRKIPIAGEPVIKFYLAFSINRLYAKGEWNTPGIVPPIRWTVLSLGRHLRQYAPDLIPTFMALEQATRTPTEPPYELPVLTSVEANKERYESLLKDTHRSSRQEDIRQAVQMALGREEYGEAEKLIALMNDPEERQRNLEDLNVRKIHYHLNKGEVLDAERAVFSLKTPKSIARTSPALIKYFVSKKDDGKALSLANFAIDAISRSNDDNRPRFLTALASSIASVDANLGIKVLEEAVNALNQHKREAKSAFAVDIDLTIFSTLTLKYENIAHQIALKIEDPLDKIMSLVAIYQQKSNKLFSDNTPSSTSIDERNTNKQQM